LNIVEKIDNVYREELNIFQIIDVSLLDRLLSRKKKVFDISNN